MSRRNKTREGARKRPNSPAGAFARVTPPIDLAKRFELFDTVASMDDPVDAIKDFAHTIAFISETISEDENLAAVFQRLAHAIIENAKTIGEKRSALFLALHPGSDACLQRLGAQAPRGRK